MRTLVKNQKQLWYCLYDKKAIILDGDGNETSDYVITYHAPVSFYANISAAKGNADLEVFGISLQYTKAIMTCDMSLPVAETSLIFETLPTGTISAKNADYTVIQVARSINSITYAVKAVVK